MRPLRALWKSADGAAVIEFALLLPSFLIMVFGIIEASRLLWVQHSFQDVAYNSARCMAINSDCDTSDKTKAFAVAKASAYGMSIATSNVAASRDVTCHGMPNSASVQINFSFDSVITGFIPGMANDAMSVSECYPLLD